MLNRLCCLLIWMGLFATSAFAETRFFAISDIHFDPFITCRHQPTNHCALIERLQAASVSSWPSILVAEDTTTPAYGSDTNTTLLNDMLEAAKERVAEDPVQFVVVLGDMLGHEFRHQYIHYTGDRSRANFAAFVKKTMTYLTNEIAKTFPKTNVYMLVGNNDSYRGDYYTDPNSAFFAEMGSLWSSLIKNPSNKAAMQREFSRAGYYAVDIPNQDKMRLIMLNTSLFSSKERNRNIQSEAIHELDWLSRQLSEAKQKHLRVFIAMHIPKSVDIYFSRLYIASLMNLWTASYTEQFEKLLTEFAPQIAGVFAGHLHSDWSQVLHIGSYDFPIVGVPSVSPIYKTPPKFKLFTYDPQDGYLLKTVTWELDIS